MFDRVLKSIVHDDKALHGAASVVLYGNSLGSQVGTPILVISGDNGTGKTVFLSHLASAFRSEFKAEGEKESVVVNIGMKMRTGADGSYGAMRTAMFGSEASRSTGTISLHILKSSFHNAREWPVKSVLMFDEPEIGLSETYYHAMGEYISQQAESLDAIKTPAIVVVTHSHIIAKTLVENGASGLHFPEEGSAMTPENWMAGNFQQQTLEHLLGLQGRAREVGIKITHHKNEYQRKIVDS